ncbi:MAG: quinoprotein dehydrogenase-associated putative ABC transporter substrate-binding protein [Hyphomicrobium zavarzinii]|uniref:quinoprotein dehydrogenase-associated putative ABC transporter substrate-binding protein n=1 Tax=Hyphomicrobium zavarzinii TaxID=48292 RepID=UPI001A54CFD3|nr:quinoprotein dehydrogenase-associated putative ABC transporter substrate-binding protein [Hyphomicrobium zavarzinii]MBL8846115.1 quinoprotein dehydrogenase-associated putative ABC transporter substrate-binding protein [Hyphomicrobium zavarzinii]
MRKLSHTLALGAVLAGLCGPAIAAENLRSFTKNKSFDDLTAAEHTATRQEARHRKLDVLRVCADPGNMPLSSSKEDGYQNKIAKIIAEDLGGHASFFWRPYHERGLTRETFQNDECDILMDMPTALQELLTTEPIYRTTYIFAHREDRKLDIKSLDDPALKDLRIGVFQHSGLREALERRGLKNLDLHVIAYDADLKPEHQPWQQVQKVIDGELDVAGVWGPFAGWLKTQKNTPIVIQPVNLWENEVPMEFDLAIGMQRNQVMLKYMIDWALTRKKDEIAAVLKDYGVPLVKCSKCAVDGDLPAHGSYYERLRNVSQDRFLKEAPKIEHTDKAAEHQIVTEARLEAWLKEGADLDQELVNAIIGNDAERVRFLIKKGADVNKRDSGGFTPLDTAARTRGTTLIGILAEAGADPNAPDADGFFPILHAINRNHVPSIEMLAKKGANLELKNKQGITPLSWALGDGKYFAAKALIDLGADVNATSGVENVTPLMVLATQLAAKTRSGNLAQGPQPLDLARLLIEKGANVNALSKDGVNALMIAAGHNNAPMIGLLAGSGADLGVKSTTGQTALDIATSAGFDAAVGALRLVSRPVGGKAHDTPPALPN